MSAPPLDPEQLARLERLAALYGSDVETLLAEALAQYLDHQEAYADAVAAGLAEADSGDLATHAAVMTALRRRFAEE